MSHLNWKKCATQMKSRQDLDSRYNAPASKHAKSIVARKIIEQSLNHMKPLFQWTDYELNLLGFYIKREWVRRRTPMLYENGKQAGKYNVKQKVKFKPLYSEPNLETYELDMAEKSKRVKTTRY